VTRIRSQDEQPTRNFFAPLRTNDMDMDSPVVEEASQKPDGEPQKKSPSQSGRPPPIVLTPTVNLIHLKKHLKCVVSDNFEFRSTKKRNQSCHEKLGEFPFS
jgi:hypothetical protein